MDNVFRSILLAIVIGIPAASLALPVLPAAAQADDGNAPAPNVNIDWFGEADGVSLGRTSFTLKDRHGFMWFGTLTGLYKFDGYRFTVFLPNPEDSTSISDTWVDALYEDREGTLWIGTVRGGLNRFNRETETFTRYQHDPEDPRSISPGQIRALYEDRAGTFWVGTKTGLNRMDRQRETFQHFGHDPDDPSSLSDNNVRAICEDHEGMLWVGTGENQDYGGLNRFDRATETFVRYLHDPDDPGTLLDNRVNDIFVDQGGTLWVGTYRGGLHRYDRERDAFTGYLFDPNDLNSLKAPFEGRIDTNYAYRGITAIHEASGQPGILWISTARMGLLRFDQRNHSFMHYTDDPDTPNALANPDTWEIYEDDKGILWIGSRDGGVHKVDPSGRAFRFYDLNNSLKAHQFFNIWKDKDGLLWTQTHDGDEALDPETGVVTPFPRYTSFLQKIRSEVIRTDLTAYLNEYALSASLQEPSGLLWIGTQRGGLIRLDLRNESFAVYRHRPEDPSGLRADRITDLFLDRENRLWVQTYGTLHLFERATATFKAFDLTRTHSILMQDTRGHLWVDGVFGVTRFDPRTANHSPYLEDLWVNSMLELSDDRFLVGTLTQGLLLLDPVTGHSTSFTIKDGLPVNAVSAVVADEQGTAWVASGDHILKFDPESGSLLNLPLPDVFEGQIFLSAVTQSASGDLYFPTARRILALTPGQLQRDTIPPPVVLTGFSISNEPVPIAKEGPLKAHISVARDLTLRHNQNDFTFEFAALDFDRPELNEYAYQLEPYDEDWTYVDTRRTAQYTNLAPGDYTFRVKAANSDGVWNEEGTSIRITILPPWWRTTWAYVLYGLLLIAAVVAAERIQRRRLIKRERQRAALEQAELRERAAQAVAEIASSQAREAEAQARALQAENERARVELEKARELEQAHTELTQAHTELAQTHEHLKTTQQQLIHAEKMASLGEMTAGIAHEINNPLNFVNNFAELSIELADDLAETLDRGESVSELLAHLKHNARSINQHGRRADAIVRSMMQHASGGVGERRSVELNGLVEEYVTLAYYGMRAQRLDFDVVIERDLSGEVGTVEVVPQEIGRVLLNLLSNAFEAVREKTEQVNSAYEPSVAVRTRQVDGKVEVRVEDNGPGIPAEIEEKIFEPFYTTKPTGTGTGLGLSLAYDIVTQGHGGMLAVESTEGEGATFVITLPAPTLRLSGSLFH